MQPLVSVQILKCRRCGTLDAGPRQLCTKCHAAAFEQEEVSGRGTLVSWTIIRRAPSKLKALQPYAVCVVDLDAGVRVTGRLQSLPMTKSSSGVEMAAGMRVQCAALDGLVPLFSAEA